MDDKKITDMLVQLYKLDENDAIFARVEQNGIKIKRAMACETGKILEYIKENFGTGWSFEAQTAMASVPATCYIATQDKKIVGFACFEATAKNYFGPIGVSENMRGTGLGKALTLKCMLAMREMGYGYAVIGWVDSARDFYKKTVGAVDIDDSHPSVYKNLTFL